MTPGEIIDIIEDKIFKLTYLNRERGYTDEFYVKNEAKIEVLEEIIRYINNQI